MASNNENQVLIDNSSSTVMVTEEPNALISDMAPIVDLYQRTTDGGANEKREAGSTSADSLLERYVLCRSFKWSSSDALYTELNTLTLPRDFVLNNKSSPTSVLFLTHRYYHGDVKIRIQVNANKFMIGQIQSSVYYCQDLDDKFEDTRNNIYSRSQMQHALLSAHINNEVEMVVKYAYPKAFMSTRSDAGEVDILKMFTLTTKVINQLSSQSRTYNSTNVVISVYFDKNCFYGLLDSRISLNEHQMFPLMKVAENMLHQINAVNRDYPPNPFCSIHVVPKSSNSLSIGTNDVLPVNPMRLDSKGQAPGLVGAHDLKIRSIVSQYGLVKQSSWTYAYTSAFNMMILPVAPIMERKQYHSLPELQNNLNLYTLPPIAVVSSMFSLWRGSIKYRIDFISSVFHSGRIALTFVPTPGYAKNNSYDVSKNSYVAYYNLGEGDRQVEFVVPYMSDNPWTPINYSDVGFNNFFRYTGQLTMYVLNPLIPMDSVQSSIDFNVYMAAGDDFELSVPVSPSLGLGWDREYITVKADNIVVLDGYQDAYSGNWRYVNGGQSCVMRYGEVTDHVVQVANGLFGAVYDSSPKAVSVYNEAGTAVYCQYMVVPRLDGDTPRYIAPVEKLTNAIEYAKTNDPKYLMNWHKNGLPVKLDMPMKLVYLNIESQVLTLKPCIDIPSITMQTIGESFDNLKDLLRRYQPYAYENIALKSSYQYGEIFLKIPVCPQGLSFSLNSKHFFNMVSNRFRHGHIPLILSYFRYWRGSLRFKIIVTGVSDRVIAIQHIPDGIIKNYKDFYPNPKESLSHMGHTYATIIQDLRVNSVIDLEVPYYLPNIYGLCQRGKFNLKDDVRQPRDIERSYSLGYLSFSLLDGLSSNVNCNIAVYYSVADDFELYVPCGFPAVTFNEQVPLLDEDTTSIEHREEDSDYIHVDVSNLKYNFRPHSEVMAETKHQNRIYSDIYHDMFTAINLISTCEKKTAASINSASKVLDDLNSIKETVSKISNFKSKICHQTNHDDIKDAILSLLGEHFGTFDAATKQFYFSAFSQLIHAFINPTVKTIAWSLTSFLISLGIISTDAFSAIHTFYEKLCNYYDSSNENHTSQGIEFNSLIDIAYKNDRSLLNLFTADELGSFVSVCCVGLLTSLGMKKTIPQKKTLADFGVWFLKGINNFTLTSNGILNLLSKTFGLISKLVKFLIGSEDKEFAWQAALQCDGLAIKDWAYRSSMLVSPLNRDKILKDIYLQKEVYECAASAQLLLAKMAGSTKGERENAIMYLSRKIIKLQQELIESHLCPPVSREPFVIQVAGKPKIGKSHIQQQIGIELLKAIDYTTYSEPIYVRTPGNKFLNNLRSQPIFVIDDFLFMCSGEIAETQIVELMNLKSRCVYNPPMAELEEKRIRYSPLIVMLNSNAAFWQLPNVYDMEAIHRRRDLLVQARKIKKYANIDIDLIPIDVKDRVGHLEFTILDPTNSNIEIEQIPDSNWLDYEKFMELAKQRFREYHIRETMSFQKCLQNVTALYPVDLTMTIEEHLEEQKRRISTLHEEIFETSLMDAPSWKSKLTTRAVSHQGKMSKKFQLISDGLKSLFIESVDLHAESVNIRNIEQFKSVCLSDDISKFVRFSEDQLLPVMKFFDIFIDVIVEKNKILPKEEYKSAIEKYAGVIASNGEYGDCVHLNLMYSYRYCPNEKIYKAVVKAKNGPSKVGEEACEGRCCLHHEIFKIVIGGLECIITPVEERISQLSIFYTKEILGESVRVSSLVDDAVLNNEIEVPDQTSFENFLNKYIKPSCNALWNLVCRFKKIIASLTALLGVAYASFRVFKSRASPDSTSGINCQYDSETQQFKFDGVPKETFEMSDVERSAAIKLGNSLINSASHQAPLSNDNSTTGAAIRKGFSAKLAKYYKGVKFAKHQTSHNEGEFEIVLRKIQRNSFSLVMRKGELYQEGKGLGLYGRVAIILKHQVEGIDSIISMCGSAELSFVCGSNHIKFNWSDCTIFSDRSSSLSFIVFPTIFPEFKNIQTLFTTSIGLEYVSSQGSLVDATGLNTQLDSVEIKLQENIQVSPDSYAEGQFLPLVFTYGVAGKGRCGSVLVSHGPKPRIVGIHVAGYSNKIGYSQPLWSEFVNSLYNDYGSKLKRVDPECLYLYDHNYKPEANIMPAGSCPKRFTRNQASKSRIIESELHGLFPVRTIPAPLSEFERNDVLRFPIDEALSKRNRIPDFNVPEYQLEELIREFSSHFISTSRPTIVTRSSTLTLEEVIVGIPGIEGYGGIELSTSEGYPWVLDRPKGLDSKKWMFKFDELRDGTRKLEEINPELSDVIDFKFKQRKSGIIPFTVFTDTLKDCRIKPEKLDKNAPTRLFSIAPVDFTLSCKQYFGHFQAAIYRNRINNFIAIGINPDSYEWKMVADHLRLSGEKVFTGDYSAFGDTLDRNMVRAAIRIINNWYEYYYPNDNIEEGNLVRTVMGEEICDAFYLCHDLYYHTFCGIPSGCPITVELDSIVNLLYIAYSFLQIGKNEPVGTLRGFFSYVRPLVYGDDLLCGIDDRVSEWFNGTSYSQFLEGRNVKFTSTEKNGTIQSYMFLDKATFLKRGFVQHPSRPLILLAPLPKDVVEEIVNWTWNTCPSKRDAAVAACRSCLEGAFGNGKEYYEQIRKILISEWLNRGYHFQSNTWEELDRRNYDTTEILPALIRSRNLDKFLSLQNQLNYINFINHRNIKKT